MCSSWYCITAFYSDYDNFIKSWWKTLFPPIKLWDENFFFNSHHHNSDKCLKKYNKKSNVTWEIILGRKACTFHHDYFWLQNLIEKQFPVSSSSWIHFFHIFQHKVWPPILVKTIKYKLLFTWSIISLSTTTVSKL